MRVILIPATRWIPRSERGPKPPRSRSFRPRPEDRDRGGFGPLSERGIHLVAGIRMTLYGLLSLAAGGYFLWTAL
jgi:hypothetical protein